jgi:DNA invertase Pin-like site-specific DNA recombinase
MTSLNAYEQAFGERPLATAPVWVFALIERSAIEVGRRYGLEPSRILTVDRSHVDRRLATAREQLAARIYEAFPHRAMLARAFGISRDTLRDWLRRAEDSGWVRPRANQDEVAA